jgi:hypothetical protein
MTTMKSRDNQYFFAVKGVNDCMPGDWSQEWSAVVGRKSGTTALVSTGSTGRTIVPSVVPSVTLRRQGTGGNVVPTVVVPTVVEQDLPPIVEPTPTPRPNFIQRFFNFLFGRR